jgi:hypothetical protein
MEINLQEYRTKDTKPKYLVDDKSEIYLPHFSIINLKMNRTFYYCKQFYQYVDLKKDSRFEFFLNQEKKFIQLILDAEPKDSLSIWSKYNKIKNNLNFF